MVICLKRLAFASSFLLAAPCTSGLRQYKYEFLRRSVAMYPGTILLVTCRHAVLGGRRVCQPMAVADREAELFDLLATPCYNSGALQ